METRKIAAACFAGGVLCTAVVLIWDPMFCAIDGTIGGAVAFFCLAAVSLTYPQQVLVVFFGGLLGTAIGVLNF